MLHNIEGNSDLIFERSIAMQMIPIRVLNLQNRLSREGCRCYTVNEIMVILGVGRKAVYSLIRQKAFPSIQIGGIGYRIPKDTFDSWLHQKENGER